MQTHIFFSHSSEDKDFVIACCAELERRGYATWVSSRDIRPGDDWDRAIEVALEKAAYVVVLCTSHSVKSSYVRTEVDNAIHTSKAVIPILVEPVELPLRWRLKQWVSAQGRTAAEVVRELLGHLPQLPVMMLQTELEAGGPFEKIRSLVVYSSLLYNENKKKHRDDWYFAIECDCVTAAGIVDIMKEEMYLHGTPPGRLDVEMWQILSPYITPEQSENLDLCGMGAAARAAIELAKSKVEWAGDMVVHLSVNFVVGRRRDFGDDALKQRRAYQSKIRSEIAASSADVTIMSFDRLLGARGLAGK
jgi:hypothetical protein